MFRIIDRNSREVLSLDPIYALQDARRIAAEIEQHESQPEVELQIKLLGEWVKYEGNQSDTFKGSYYSLKIDGPFFVLETPAREAEYYDNFEELLEFHPVCEEARTFFFGEQ